MKLSLTMQVNLLSGKRGMGSIPRDYFFILFIFLCGAGNKLFSTFFYYDEKLDIYLYDIGGAFSLLLAIIWVFSYISFRKKPVVKFLVFSGIIFGLKDLIEVLLFDNLNVGTFWIDLICFGFIIIYGNKMSILWSLKKVKSDIINQDGIYRLYCVPTNFLTFLGSIFGIGVGSMKVLIVNNNKITMFGFNGSYRFGYKEITYKNHFNNILRFEPCSDVIALEVELKAMNGLLWLPWRNCLTVFKKPFKKFCQHRIFSIFASVDLLFLDYKNKKYD